MADFDTRNSYNRTCAVARHMKLRHFGAARFAAWLMSAWAGLVFAGAPQAPPLEAYARLPALNEPRISHSGHRLAFIATIDETRRLVTQDVYGKGLMTAILGDMKVRDVQWAGEDLVLLRTSTTQNLGMDYGFEYELANLIVINVATMKVSMPLGNSKFLPAAFGYYGTRYIQGAWYEYVGTVALEHDRAMQEVWISGSGTQLTSIDLASGKLHVIATKAGHGRGWLLGGEGAILARDSYDPVEKSWSLYGGTHESKPLVQLPDVYGQDRIAGRGRTEGTVLYSERDSTGDTHFMELALAGGQPATEIFHDKIVSRLLFDPATELLIGAETDSATHEMVVFDAERETAINTVRHTFPRATVRVVDWSDDYQRWLVETEAVDDSGTWWFVDLGTHRAVRFGGTYPDVEPAQVGPYRIVKYHAADGLAMQGVLTLPPGVPTKGLPLVVLPHGGPEAHDDPRFDWWAQAFASRGYAVWQPNYRGSSGFGAAFRNAGYGEWGRKMQTDISDGVAELVRQGIVDPHRACIVGGSYGGYAALAGVTVQQGLYRCAVSVAGISDLNAMLSWETDQSSRNVTRYWQNFMGAKGFHNYSLAALSPALLAERADAPILLIHGKDDTVVPISQSRQMQRALSRAHKPVEFVQLDGEDHWLSREKTRIAMLQAAMEFVQRYNPANQSAAPTLH
ncbi:MAG: alpha/beta hydrolase family protein [Steroidobacteraceae bacterium]